MAKEKKEPKGASKGFLSKDAEVVLLGLMLGLVALIGLLNRGPIGQFLSYITVYLFGVFYFLVYLVALFFSVYLILKRKAYQVHIRLGFLGIILFLIGVMIAASPSSIVAADELRLSNVFSEFSKSMASISRGVLIEDITQVQGAGGGLVGYFLAALLNTAITPIGTTVVYMILMLAGLVLALYRPSEKLIKWWKKHQAKKKEQLAKKAEEEATEQFLEQDVTLPEVNLKEDNQPIPSYENVSSANTAQKAKFVFHTSSQESVSSKPLFAEDIEEDPVIDEPSVMEETPLVDEESLVEEEETIEPMPLKHPETHVPKANKITFHPAPKPIMPAVKNETKKTEVVKEKPYIYPDISLLNDYETVHVDEENDRVSIERQAMINGIFDDLGIGATISGYKVGPSVTRFDVLTNRDVSVNIVAKYIDDISVRLGGVNARFEKVVRGKMTSGLEIPNAQAVTVSFKECIVPTLGQDRLKYRVPFGKDITGDVIGVNVTDYPHLLVAGSTGSGKSVFMHCLIMSLIMKTKPSELRIMLIDPKRVEMAKYKEMPHLICPIISEYDRSKVAMNKLVAEMERRYQLFEDAGVSKVSQYNEYAEEEGLDKLPVIVVVIDEYADLVENCKDIASPVVRIAQKSRAAGIHMIISTQRPSVNVITGVIKGNLPSRVALRVASAIDSQTILGEGGAEKLLGYGDMLVDCPEISGAGFTRLQCPYVDNKEIRRVVDFLKEHYPTDYDPEFIDLTDRSAAGPAFPGSMPGSNYHDDRYDEVKAYVMNLNETSISELQRTFGFGFPRAGRIFTQLQQDGILAKSSEGGSNKRKVLLRNQSALQEGDSSDDQHS